MKFVSVLSGFLLGGLLSLGVVYAGGPNSGGVCFGGGNANNFCRDNSFCPGGFCQFEPLLCKDGPASGSRCLSDADCSGSQCINAGSFKLLPHVCSNGPNKGKVCSANSNCDGNACTINLVSSTTVKGTLTIIVDNDAFPPGGVFVSCGGALALDRIATVLLEVKKSGKRHFFSEGYRCPFFFGSLNFFNREDILHNAVTSGAILNAVLFETSGAMAQGLRDLFNSTGAPVILKVSPSIDKVAYTDHEDDALASVVRIDVTIGFVPSM